MNQRAQSQREFTGRHMLAIMLAFFGVIVAVNLTMAWFAGNSWTGLVVKNSYVASQQYNDKLRAAEVQRQRGWQTRLSYQDGSFSFRLADRAGDPVVLDGLAMSVGRPATEVQDHRVALQKKAAGHYTAQLRLAPGLWGVVITGARGDQPFRYERRLTVRAGG